ncbi:Mannan-binding lectin serine protease 2 [Bagarius yarrelli]|uniref:Mannan-binding lectin serine protease 2 n=1 Tax=Bagarius yarrelli TaxID=175774 RepID=A0A556U1K4_BAGYA|nr:Mannan-binding lectin serine protease 2 [Bagarius yarrelli]
MVCVSLWISVCVSLASVCQSFSHTGQIRSPGFPHGYSSDLSKTWRLCAPPGHVLALTLLHLDLEASYECENDNLKIFEDHSLLANLCGKMTHEELQSMNPSLRSSSGGCLNVTFQSDYSNTKRHTGFFLFYTIQVNCTEQRYGAGVVTSPGSPGPYFESSRCSFYLTVDTRYQIELKFTGVFDIESRNGRCIDFVKIKTDHKTIGPFCGKDKPEVILTASRHAEVIFHSDLEGTNQVMQCHKKVPPHATVSPMKELYAMGETIQVHCDVGYVLIDDTDSHEPMCLLDGSWSSAPSCDPVDCGVPELPFMMQLMVDVLDTTYKHNITVYCFSEYYQLEGAANFTCEATGDWVSENGDIFSKESPQCTPVCGMTKEFFGSRIFGGKKAQLGQIPWQLLVKHPDRGGAALINDYWAITAAHVVEDKRTRIFIGGMIDAQGESIQMETEKILIHPDYKPQNYDNDIALVKMTSRVPLNQNLLPVCLSKTKSKEKAMENMSGTISGFGGISKTNKQARFLWYANVKEYQKVCFDSPLEVTENMFCAGDAEGKADSCKGDSGGPLVIPAVGLGSVETPYRLKGIVSWGPECGSTHYKGYYTKVDNYLTWINDMIKNN